MALRNASQPAEQPRHLARHQLSDPGRGSPSPFYCLAASGFPPPAQPLDSLRRANPACIVGPGCVSGGPGRGLGPLAEAWGSRAVHSEMDWDLLDQSAQGAPKYPSRRSSPARQQRPHLDPHHHWHTTGASRHSPREPTAGAPLRLEDSLFTENKALQAYLFHPSATLQLLGPKGPLQTQLGSKTGDSTVPMRNTTVSGREVGRVRGAAGGVPVVPESQHPTQDLLLQLLLTHSSRGDFPGCDPGAPSAAVQVPDVHCRRASTPAARVVPAAEMGHPRSIATRAGAPGAAAPAAGISHDACVAASGPTGAYLAIPASAAPAPPLPCLGTRARVVEHTAEGGPQKRRRVMGGEAAASACGTPAGNPKTSAQAVPGGVPGGDPQDVPAILGAANGVLRGVPGSRSSMAGRRPWLVPPTIGLPPYVHPASLTCPSPAFHQGSCSPLASPAGKGSATVLAPSASASGMPQALPGAGGLLAGPGSGTPLALPAPPQIRPGVHQAAGIPKATPACQDVQSADCSPPCLPLHSSLSSAPEHLQAFKCSPEQLQALDAKALTLRGPMPPQQLVASPQSTTVDPSSAVTSPRDRRLRGPSPAGLGAPVTVAVTAPVTVVAPAPVAAAATGPVTPAVTEPVPGPATGAAPGLATRAVTAPGRGGTGTVGSGTVAGAGLAPLGQPLMVYPGAAARALGRQLGEARREAGLLVARNATLERELAAARARLAEAVGSARASEHQAGLLRQCLQHCLERLRRRDTAEEVGENIVPAPVPPAPMPLPLPGAAAAAPGAVSGAVPGAEGIPGGGLRHVRLKSAEPAESFCGGQAGREVPGREGRVGGGREEDARTAGEDAEDGLCRICWDKRASVLLIPCRHLVLCKACEPTVTACPACLDSHKAVIHVRMD